MVGNIQGECPEKFCPHKMHINLKVEVLAISVSRDICSHALNHAARTGLEFKSSIAVPCRMHPLVFCRYLKPKKYQFFNLNVTTALVVRFPRSKYNYCQSFHPVARKIFPDFMNFLGKRFFNSLKVTNARKVVTVRRPSEHKPRAYRRVSTDNCQRGFLPTFFYGKPDQTATKVLLSAPCKFPVIQKNISDITYENKFV
jgi:hypothetical protein